MTRYQARKQTRASDDPWMTEWKGYPMVPDISVDDATGTPTGLLDHKGNPIYRMPNPIGFGRWR